MKHESVGQTDKLAHQQQAKLLANCTTDKRQLTGLINWWCGRLMCTTIIRGQPQRAAAAIHHPMRPSLCSRTKNIHKHTRVSRRQEDKNKGPARFCRLRVFLEGLRRASPGKYIACTRQDRGASICADLAGTLALVPPSPLARLRKANLAVQRSCGRWRTGDERDPHHG